MNTRPSGKTNTSFDTKTVSSNDDGRGGDGGGAIAAMRGCPCGATRTRACVVCACSHAAPSPTNATDLTRVRRNAIGGTLPLQPNCQLSATHRAPRPTSNAPPQPIARSDCQTEDLGWQDVARPWWQ